ncbi:MAG: hypothetical protein ABW168_13490 [Sedimenticola sp.]
MLASICGLKHLYVDAFPLPWVAGDYNVMPVKMKTTLEIFTDAKNEKNALVVLNKVKNKTKFSSLSERCEPYHKGGFVCNFEVNVHSSNWEEMPYKLLSLCQSIGRSWQVLGSIDEEFDAWSNESSVSGAERIHVQCLHQA